MKWTKKNSTQENWSKEETKKFVHEQAIKQSKILKDSREGKKFKLVKVSDHPLTFKEVELK